jgi:hypothetical protein
MRVPARLSLPRTIPILTEFSHPSQFRTANQALEQTRDNVLRYGEVVGCELLNFFVSRK